MIWIHEYLLCFYLHFIFYCKIKYLFYSWLFSSFQVHFFSLSLEKLCICVTNWKFPQCKSTETFELVFFFHSPVTLALFIYTLEILSITRDISMKDIVIPFDRSHSKLIYLYWTFIINSEEWLNWFLICVLWICVFCNSLWFHLFVCLLRFTWYLHSAPSSSSNGLLF